MSALRALLFKEIYHILRDKRTLAVMILIPVAQVLLFGFSIRTDVRDVRIAFVEPQPDASTRELRLRFEAGETFRTVAVVPRRELIDPLFQTDTVQVSVEFEPGFGERLSRGLPARVHITADAVDPNSAAARLNYVREVIGAWERARGTTTPGIRIVPVVRNSFNPTRESSHLFVPGLMAFVLNIISALMTALSLSREKEAGTMEALLVSPLRPWQIILGKVLPYLAIGFLAVCLVLVEARVVFGVPIRGSLPLLLAEGLLFCLVALSIGILVSSRAASQRAAMMGVIMGTMLPTQMLSGFIFPIESMPAPLQWISNAVPARWFVAIARGVMLKGVGFHYLQRETLVLAVMTIVLLVIATRSFKTRLA
jgi:ABC-2 type transport system permease protein